MYNNIYKFQKKCSQIPYLQPDIHIFLSHSQWSIAHIACMYKGLNIHKCTKRTDMCIQIQCLQTIFTYCTWCFGMVLIRAWCLIICMCYTTVGQNFFRLRLNDCLFLFVCQRLPPRGATERSSTERHCQRADQPVHHDPVAASPREPPEWHYEGLHCPVRSFSFLQKSALLF